MIQENPKDKDVKKEKEDSNIKPDPETLGPNPEEHMKGPVSSIVRKIGEEAEENDKKDTPKDVEKKKEEEE